MNEYHIIYPEKVLLHYQPPMLKEEQSYPKKDLDKDKFPKKPLDVQIKMRNKKAPLTFQDLENALALEETTSLINAMLPPLNYELDNAIYTQHVSPIPGTRADVILLTHCLASLEKQRKTKNKIVCPIRREIYSDLFDELIRQLTIQCTERGLLLLRVKNEITMTLNSYQCITNNFINFGVRQFVLTEPEKLEHENKIEALTNEVKRLKDLVKGAKKRCNTVQKSVNNQHSLAQINFSTTIKWYETIQSQMKLQLDDIISQFKPE